MTYPLATALKTQFTRKSVRPVAIATVSLLFLAGCVSSNLDAFNTPSQNTAQAVATPQVAVLAGDPSFVETQDVDQTNAGVVGGGQPSGTVSQNTPQRSPLKQAITPTPVTQTAEAVQPVNPAPLAIADPSVRVDPAVQQVAAIAETTAPNAPIPTTRPVTNTGILLTSNELANAPAAATASTDTVIAPAQSVDTTGTEAEIEATTSESPALLAALPPAEPEVKKPNLLQRLFANRERKSTTRNNDNLSERFASSPRTTSQQTHLDEDSFNNRFTNTSTKQRTKTKIKTISRTQTAAVGDATNNTAGALPGVKSNNEIFGIKEDPQVTENKANTQLAALGNLSRISPNGLRLQHDKVQVACLKPGVLRIITQVERHYGKKPIITSGYRSPKRNRRAGGARNSQHVFCKAVDMQVEGVSKWQLAKYLRSIPGRGGVGTYCRTKSVHIDTGKKRDWHHKCRSSAKRKRKKA